MIARLALALAVSALSATAAPAQGNVAGDSLQGTNGGDSGSAGTTAQVGAGTDNGTTTGFSQPPSPDGGGGPPQITAALCDFVAETPAHADCLSKIMPKGSTP